ncbi:hypothetical protein PVNG_06350 [Plasmodium vivax North Korean]|uniref:Uncharacterized protein n=1 Tax=Plasmodium vivax North Korean TaxID=1035514 RepID=A0A0J9TN44_PLAVI|nr:hypothetical protein PVNG_06350 [Plasmodium vivax North Korean]
MKKLYELYDYFTELKQREDHQLCKKEYKYTVDTMEEHLPDLPFQFLHHKHKDWKNQNKYWKKKHKYWKNQNKYLKKKHKYWKNKYRKSLNQHYQYPKKNFHYHDH